jgi:hypothetical protein
MASIIQTAQVTIPSERTSFDRVSRNRTSPSDINPHWMTLDEMNSETFGRQMWDEDDIKTYIGTTAPLFDSFKGINIYQYAEQPIADPAVLLFSLLVNGTNRVVAQPYVIEFLEDVELDYLYEFVRDHIAYVANILREYRDQHIIVYEMFDVYKKSKYYMRMSLCLTSNDTIIMREYYKVYNYISFHMNYVEFDLRGNPVVFQTYRLRYTNHTSNYTIDIVNDVSVRKLNMLKSCYPTEICDIMIENMVSTVWQNAFDHYILEDMLQAMSE